jgi:hypothetical protein
MSDITGAIAGLTGRLVAYRIVRGIKMGRLEDKLAQAGGVVARQTAKIEARADAIIAREAAIEAQTEQAFAPHESILSEAESGLDTLSRQLAPLTNGGPPLELSSASPAAPVAPEPPASQQPGS